MVKSWVKLTFGRAEAKNESIIDTVDFQALHIHIQIQCEYG